MTSEFSNTPTSLNAAIIGTGFIGPVHVEALRRNGIPVIGILGSNPAKSKKAAEAMGIPRAYGQIDELLNDADVDVVHITSPNHLHFEQASAVLNAGKHVLCEKPLAMDSKESAALVKLAHQKQRVAGVAYNIRFYPLCHQASQMIRDGELGNLMHVHGSYTQDWLLYPSDFNWRVLSGEGGQLRAVADIGTHWLDLVQFIAGCKVKSVFSDLRIVHPQRFLVDGGRETFSSTANEGDATQSVSIDTEDCGSILLRFENGMNGCLWVSQVSAGRKNCLRFEIGGSKRSLSWNSESPNELWIGNRDETNGNLIRDPALLETTAAQIASYPGGHNEGYPDSFKQLIRCFYKHIAEADIASQTLFPTFADGHHEVLLCEAILKSHREECWIELEDENAIGIC